MQLDNLWSHLTLGLFILTGGMTLFLFEVLVFAHIIAHVKHRKVDKKGVIGRANLEFKSPFIRSDISIKEFEAAINSHTKLINEALIDRKPILSGGIELPDKDFFERISVDGLALANGIKPYFKQRFPTLRHLKMFIRKLTPEKDLSLEYEILMQYMAHQIDTTCKEQGLTNIELINKFLEQEVLSLINFHLYMCLQELKGANHVQDKRQIELVRTQKRTYAKASTTRHLKPNGF